MALRHLKIEVTWIAASKGHIALNPISIIIIHYESTIKPKGATINKYFLAFYYEG